MIVNENVMTVAVLRGHDTLPVRVCSIHAWKYCRTLPSFLSAVFGWLGPRVPVRPRSTCSKSGCASFDRDSRDSEIAPAPKKHTQHAHAAACMRSKSVSIRRWLADGAAASAAAAAATRRLRPCDTTLHSSMRRCAGHDPQGLRLREPRPPKIRQHTHARCAARTDGLTPYH
jgi:hypothetical protein